ncbi:MAG: hypothetical protein HY954_11985 [Deltaproteobacteria bacterium]|nr:hypothetical protein [Deltaproteobacteria bacterium]
MRRSLWILSAVFFWVMLVAMAKPPGAEVPVPEIDFKATVRDDQDVMTKVSRVSWEGNIFFTGVRGKGVVTISFEKIRKVSSLGGGNGTRSDFQITLKNGDVVAVSLDNEERFLGVTNFGTYRIASKNIKEIVFE